GRNGGDQVVGDARDTGFAQQLLDSAFALVVAALAELVATDPAFGVDEVDRRPVMVAERAPDVVGAVERDRVPDVHLRCGPANVVRVLLERELRRVDADRDQPSVLVLLGPGADVGEGAQPVDAGVRPELDEDDLAAEVVDPEGRGVEPAGGPVEPGEIALGGRGGVPGQAEGGQGGLNRPTAGRGWRSSPSTWGATLGGHG